ncbi:hypothetical protein V6N13_057538 [Hibiscus sabdariffa]
MVSEPVLVLPDYTKPFEIYTDASDFAIGGVLMQEGHPVAFESRKLKDAERRYTVQEKEMTAVVHCLRTWRHYILGSRFVVYTDNIANSYFLTQKKLSPKQARWQEFLAEFDFTMEHKAGKVNSVADALSRKANLVAISQPEGQLLERIKEGLGHDPVAETLIGYAKEGKSRHYWLEGGLLYTRGNRLYIPQFGNLRKHLMKESHDSKWAGHPGIHRTTALLADQYYWPHMGRDVEAYVKTCLVCQQDKVEAGKPMGLLQPLPIPERPWESISMDFIIGLPKVDDFLSIMVVVDRFSKYATFIPASKVCPAEEAARLFLKHVVKYWGVPKTIVSDRDTRFTGRFWTELFKLLGSDLNFSTSFHPQTDGQTERVNALLEIYLRHYVSATQRDWPKLLDVAQFSFNLQRNEATSRSPFEIVTGQQPLTPNAVVSGYEGPNPAAYKFAKAWQEQHDLARACLHNAGKRTKKWADRKRRDMEFQVGDMVLAKLNLTLRNQSVHKALVRRYEGPFKVVKRVGNVAYKLELPSKLRAHPVFHVSMLKPFHADTDDPERSKSRRAPIGVKISYEKEIESIQADRVVRRQSHRPRHEYFVLWKGQPTSEGSWEPAEALWQFEDKVADYHARAATRASLNQVGENVTGGRPMIVAGFDNDPSAGSPTETLLRLLLPLNDKVQWTSRDVAGSEPPTSPRSEHFTGPFNRNLNDASPAQGPCDPSSYHESSEQRAKPASTFYLINASLPEVGDQPGSIPSRRPSRMVLNTLPRQGEAITRREHRSCRGTKCTSYERTGPRPYAHEIFRIRKHDRASMHRRSRIMSIDTLGTPGTTEVHQATTRSLDGQGMAIHPIFHRFRYATQDPYRTPWARRPQGEDIEE